MSNTPAEYWRHREDPDVVIRVLKDDEGTISVCGSDPNTTVFRLTRAELDFNFEPLPERSDREPTSTQEDET